MCIRDSAYPGRNPERALIWGLTQLYLERSQPDRALVILDAWREPAGFWQSVRSFFDRSLNDDDLRSTGLRLRAVLQQDAPDTRCLLYTSPSPRDRTRSRMPSSA